MFEFILFIHLLVNDGTIIKEEVLKGSCDSWFQKNVKIVELNNNRVIHRYKNKIIVGYYCSDDLPN
jgi:hypothetical protein